MGEWYHLPPSIVSKSRTTINCLIPRPKRHDISSSATVLRAAARHRNGKAATDKSLIPSLFFVAGEPSSGKDDLGSGEVERDSADTIDMLFSRLRFSCSVNRARGTQFRG